jgi:hypothetical protein
MFRSFGFSYAVSAVLQAVVTVGAGLLCWLVWRRSEGETHARVALTTCLAVLATPYGFLYDLCGVSIAFAALAYKERRLLLSDVVLWIWPVLGLIIALNAYLELTPLVLCLSARRAWRAGRLIPR